ncbi:hypothetical protein V8E51_012883 [Hyaloscypha variabilis]
MKTITALLLGFLSLVSADLDPRDNSTSVASSPLRQRRCAAGDVNCEAQCIGSAHPNSVQVSETNECAAKCPQGNGTYSESWNYASCLQACISSYYPTSQTAGAVGGSDTAAATNGAGVIGTMTGTAAEVATGTGPKSSASTPTGSRPTASPPNMAAISVPSLCGSAGSIAGLFIIFLAL